MSLRLRLPHLFALLLAGVAAAALAQTASTDGEVKKVDAGQQKITLKHGEIKNLDMPPMTMAFRVKDAGMLSQVAVGDKVKFAVEKVDGAYTITQIQKAN